MQPDWVVQAWRVKLGDGCASGGRPVTRAHDLQKLMFSDAIGCALAITVMSNGALVDVIAQPSELVLA
jgi:hypothetical protein